MGRLSGISRFFGHSCLRSVGLQSDDFVDAVRVDKCAVRRASGTGQEEDYQLHGPHFLHVDRRVQEQTDDLKPPFEKLIFG